MTPEREAVDTLEWGKRLPEYVLFYLGLFWKIHEQKRQSSSRAGIRFKGGGRKRREMGRGGSAEVEDFAVGSISAWSLLPLVPSLITEYSLRQER
jgi:hypothetical protein